MVGSEIRIFLQQGAYRPFKVIQGEGRWFWHQSKGRMDFLVINSNRGPILHRFWDMVTYWLKSASFSYHFHFHLTPSLWVNPSEFLDELFITKTRVEKLCRITRKKWLTPYWWRAEFANKSTFRNIRWRFLVNSPSQWRIHCNHLNKPYKKKCIVIVYLWLVDCSLWFISLRVHSTASTS